MKKLLVLFVALTGSLILAGCGSTDSTTNYQVAISASPSEGGTVSPSSGQYEEGTSLDISATPSEEYRFVGWQGDYTDTSSSATITVDSDKNIQAIFAKKEYALTINTEGEGTVDETIVQTTSTTDYESGTTVELTANPAEGWKFVEWQGDLTSAENPAQITIDEAKEVTAVFEKKSFALSVNTNGEGTVKIDPEQETYSFNTTVNLTANPAEGWRFIEWQGDVTGKENPAQITIDENKEVIAVFEQLFFLGKNEVTVKCPEANIGDTGVINGVSYTKRTRDQITGSNAATTCTSGITDMSSMFSNAVDFNGDISSWDISNVTNMSYMFDGANSFNQQIGNWDVSNVTDMRYMLSASSFNSDISNWDVNNVNNMKFMFAGAISFNQNIDDWDVSSVNDMRATFANAQSFNQPIDKWDVSNVTTMLGMFTDARSFNQDISSWDVSHVTNMRSMFADAYSFDQNIGTWDVSNVTTMRSMFRVAKAFNSNISGWDVSNVSNMYYMFGGASSFNQDISGWCVSKIKFTPNKFAVNSPLIEEHKPVWGSCPSN